jgi:spore maturation protein B
LGCGNLAAVGVYIMPVVIGFILIFGLVKRVNVFDEFLIGAKEGMKSTASIAPA